MLSSFLNSLSEPLKFRKSKVDSILNERMTLIGDIVRRAVSYNSAFDDMNVLIKYIMSTTLSVYSRVEASGDLKEKENVEELVDIINAVIMSTMQYYENTGDIHATLQHFAYQYLKLLYKNVKFSLYLLNGGAEVNVYKYLFIIEPIPTKEEDKVSLEEATKIAKNIINIFSFAESEKQSFLTGVIMSDLWINDYNELNILGDVIDGLDDISDAIFKTRIGALKAMGIDANKYEEDLADTQYESNSSIPTSIADEGEDDVDEEEYPQIIGCPKWEASYLNAMEYLYAVSNHLYVTINKLASKVKSIKISPTPVEPKKMPITKHMYDVLYQEEGNEEMEPGANLVYLEYKKNNGLEDNSKIDETVPKITENTKQEEVIKDYTQWNLDRFNYKITEDIADFRSYTNEMLGIMHNSNIKVDCNCLKKMTKSFKAKSSKLKIIKVCNENDQYKIYASFDSNKMLFTLSPDCDIINKILVHEE